jgi:hypothetical protein
MYVELENWTDRFRIFSSFYILRILNLWNKIQESEFINQK